MKSNIATITLLLLISTFSCYGQKAKRFKARNGITFEYEVILPANYSKSKSYELAVVFSEIERANKGYTPTLAGVKEAGSLSNTILFIPKVPVGESDWISHPIHHGLNDFMKNMRSEYGKSNQKFHFIGHRMGGRVAQTYSGMSSQYVASISFAYSSHWGSTKQEYFDQIFNRGFDVYVYDKSASGLALNVSNADFKAAGNFSSALKTIDGRIRSL